jgi:hypothetical protein
MALLFPLSIRSPLDFSMKQYPEHRVGDRDLSHIPSVFLGLDISKFHHSLAYLVESWVGIVNLWST